MNPRRDPAAPAEEEEDLRSRTDARRERQEREEALLRHAATLVGLGDGMLAKLDLPESVVEAVTEARRIRSAAARNRALRVVRAALRDMDFEALERAIARMHRSRPAGGRGPAGAP